MRNFFVICVLLNVALCCQAFSVAPRTGRRPSCLHSNNLNERLSMEMKKGFERLSYKNERLSSEIKADIKAEIKALSWETKAEIKALSSETKAEIKALSYETKALSSETKAEIKALSYEIKAVIQALSSDTKALSSEIKTEIKALSYEIKSALSSEIWEVKNNSFVPIYLFLTVSTTSTFMAFLASLI